MNHQERQSSESFERMKATCHRVSIIEGDMHSIETNHGGGYKVNSPEIAKILADNPHQEDDQNGVRAFRIGQAIQRTIHSLCREVTIQMGQYCQEFNDYELPLHRPLSAIEMANEARKMMHRMGKRNPLDDFPSCLGRCILSATREITREMTRKVEATVEELLG
jgi:hypothetical protein